MQLTDRDREMLLLIGADLTYRAVGLKLDLAESTVKNRMAVLIHEYGAQTSVGLIVKLIRLGLLTVEEMPDKTESAWVQRARADQ